MLTRPELERRFDGALTRTVTSVIAAPGFGKTTALGEWARRQQVAWHTVSPFDASPTHLLSSLIDALATCVPGIPPELAAAASGSLGPDAATDEDERAQVCGLLLCDALDGRLRHDVALVLDDCHSLSSAGARLVETVCRAAPPRLHLVLASRTKLPFTTQRLQAQGQAVEIGAAELAFDVDEVAELMRLELGQSIGALIELLHRRTGGWPALVRLGIEAMRPLDVSQRVTAIEGLAPADAMAAYLAEEVLGAESDSVRQLLQTVMQFERVTADLCTALGVDGAGEMLAAQARRGLLLASDVGGGRWFALNPLVRGTVERRLPLDDEHRRDLHRWAADWFAANECIGEAARSRAEVDDWAGLAALLADTGPALLVSGRAAELAQAGELLPGVHRTAGIEALCGQAHQALGQWDRALACFERASATGQSLDAGSAWRMGLIHYLRGELDVALNVYRGARAGGDPRDEAFLFGWCAAAEWIRGEADACDVDAHRAFACAERSGDDGAMAAGHTALALLAALKGDRVANETHYVRALGFALRAGDVPQEIRIRTNVGSRLLEEGAAAEALEELNRAVNLAQVTGFGSFRALALANRGWAQFCLGRLEEAIADLEVAKLLYERMGSLMVAYPLGTLGTVYLERGDTALAQAAFEEAIVLSEPSGDLQGLVPALSGLATLLAHEEPDAATSLAERAVAAGSPMGQVGALLAMGWVALCRGRSDRAADAGHQAETAARRLLDKPGLGESLELLALAESTPGDASLDRLDEAIAIWTDVGNPVGLARAEMTRAILDGSRARAEQRAAHMRLLGARGTLVMRQRLLAAHQSAGQPPVRIAALGGFQVLRGSEPVPSAEWQSNAARDLLKLLVAHRGQPAQRAALAETLWPDEEPRLLTNRLSVVLATVRAVLDPERAFPLDHFVYADRAALRLNLGAVEVDVEEFLRDAYAGLDPKSDSRHLLRAAEAAYAGDFLEENALDDWATALRDEARSAYLRVLRARADESEAAGDDDLTVRYLLRILERDPFDERAHLDLVRALTGSGRHGEARQAYGTYLARMQELGIEPAALPAMD